MDTTCDDCPFKTACPFKAGRTQRCTVGRHPLGYYSATWLVLTALSLFIS